MVKTLLQLETRTFSKKRALAKTEKKACRIFEGTIDGLKKDGFAPSFAQLVPTNIKRTGLFKYRVAYEIEVKRDPKIIKINATITKASKPTKKQVKAAPKKVVKKVEKKVEKKIVKKPVKKVTKKGK